MPLQTRRHGRVLVADLGATVGWRALGPGEGNFSMSGFRPGQIEPAMVFDRDVPYERVEGKRVPITGSITLMIDGPLYSSSVLTPFDYLMKRAIDAGSLGAASSPAASATTTDAGGQVYAMQLRFEVRVGGVFWCVNLPDTTFSADAAEAESANTLSLNYECWALPIFGAP